MNVHHTGKSDNHDALRQRINNDLVNIEHTVMSEKNHHPVDEGMLYLLRIHYFWIQRSK